VVRLAVVGASTDAAHQAIEDSLSDIGVDMRALAGGGMTDRDQHCAAAVTNSAPK